MNFAEVYDAHHSIHTEDLPFWRKLAGEQGGPILELGAGTGRVYLPLLLDGYDVAGLDYDIEMFKVLRTKCPQPLQRRLNLVCADFMAMPFRQQFQQIIFPCNTFSTLEKVDKEKLLQSANQLLKESGSFTASFPNPEIMRKLPPESELIVEEVIEFPQTGTPLQVSSGWEKQGDIFTLIWGYDLLRMDGMVDHLEVRTRHIIQSAQDIIQIFKKAGFTKTELWGDYDFPKYFKDSPYLIIQAIK